MGEIHCWIFVYIFFISCIVKGEQFVIYNNISVLAGNDARIICHNVSSPGPHPMWEKILPEPDYKLISYNSKTTNTSRYSTINGYDLLIKEVNLQDEGVYQCANENEKYAIALQISVPMEELTLTWSSPPPFEGNSPVALVCRSTHSRPPADLRWYRGAHEVHMHTPMANSLKTVTDKNGFGNSESILSVLIDKNEPDIPYRCTADLPGQRMVQTAFLFPPFTSLSTMCVPSIWWVWLSISLTINHHL